MVNMKKYTFTRMKKWSGHFFSSKTLMDTCLGYQDNLLSKSTLSLLSFEFIFFQRLSRCQRKLFLSNFRFAPLLNILLRQSGQTRHQTRESHREEISFPLAFTKFHYVVTCLLLVLLKFSRPLRKKIRAKSDPCHFKTRTESAPTSQACMYVVFDVFKAMSRS